MNRRMQVLLSVARRVVFIAGLFAVAAFVNSQGAVVPAGGEYAITGAMVGDQTRPGIALNPSGGYLVWQDNSISPYGLRIVARRLDASLAANTTNIVVSAAARSKAIGDQEKPQVVLLPDGGAVFVWQSSPPCKRAKRGTQQLYARFMNASGAFVGRKDVRVSRNSRINQFNPAVAVLADGSVIVVWTSSGQDGSMQGVFGQRFSGAGARLGNEFPVNMFTANNQRNPAVAALANGNYVVTWISELQRGQASVDVFARIFNDAGPVTGEFPVNISTNNACANPSVAVSPGGGFMVAWSQKDDVMRGEPSNVYDPVGTYDLSLEYGTVGFATSLRSTNSWDIFGRLYDASGTNATTPPFRLNEYSYGDQFAPTLCAAGTQYVAVWTSLGQDGSREGVFGRALTEGGAFAGSEFQVNSRTISRQIQPAVASDGDYRCLVVWSSIMVGTGFDLFAQRYSQ
jgi:hypothetical protein